MLCLDKVLMYQTMKLCVHVFGFLQQQRCGSSGGSSISVRMEKSGILDDVRQVLSCVITSKFILVLLRNGRPMKKAM